MQLYLAQFSIHRCESLVPYRSEIESLLLGSPKRSYQIQQGSVAYLKNKERVNTIESFLIVTLKIYLITCVRSYGDEV